jgi:hypothetical protein
MITCDSIESWLVRYGDTQDLPAGVPDDVAAHVGSCAVCQRAIGEQRQARRLLQAPALDLVPPSFAAAVRARLDSSTEPGWLDLVNWRAWTVGLTPVAAALVLAAYLGGAGASTGGTADGSVATVSEDVIVDASATTPAAILMQPDSTGELLLETVLLGAAPREGTQ